MICSSDIASSNIININVSTPDSCFFSTLALAHQGARVPVRDEDVPPTDNPPSTYLRRAPLTRRTPWHDRCSAEGVGIRGWPRGGDRASTYL